MKCQQIASSCVLWHRPGHIFSSAVLEFPAVPSGFGILFMLLGIEGESISKCRVNEARDRVTKLCLRTIIYMHTRLTQFQAHRITRWK